MVKAEAMAAPERDRRGQATERKLMAAVIALLDEGGLAACSVPALAERAGVATGALYRRHADKDALIAAALLDMVGLAEGADEAVFAALALEADDLAGFLRAVAEAAVGTVREHGRLLLAMREFSRKSPDLAWRARFIASYGRGREAVLAAAVARFGDEVRGGEAALRMALAAIYGAVEVTWLDPVAGLFAAAPGPEAFVAALVDMQLRYLA